MLIVQMYMYVCIEGQGSDSGGRFDKMVDLISLKIDKLDLVVVA